MNASTGEVIVVLVDVDATTAGAAGAGTLLGGAIRRATARKSASA